MCRSDTKRDITLIHETQTMYSLPRVTCSFTGVRRAPMNPKVFTIVAPQAWPSPSSSLCS